MRLYKTVQHELVQETEAVRYRQANQSPRHTSITNYHFEGKPGFSVRYLHPHTKEKLVLKSYVLSRGRIRAVSEEEIPNPHQVH